MSYLIGTCLWSILKKKSIFRIGVFCSKFLFEAIFRVFFNLGKILFWYFLVVAGFLKLLHKKYVGRRLNFKDINVLKKFFLIC